jgi:hypothetical protein
MTEQQGRPSGEDSSKGDAPKIDAPKPTPPKAQGESQFPKPEMQVFQGGRDDPSERVLWLSQGKPKK